MTTTGLPFDDLRNLLRQMPKYDSNAAVAVRKTFEGAGHGEGALGLLEETAVWLAGATGRVPPHVVKPLMAIFAATHSISRHMGDPDPVATAQARVEQLASGAAAVSQLCQANDLGLNVFDLALDLPVEDVSEASALDERGCAATAAYGMEATAAGCDLLCLSALETAGGLPAACVLSALSGEDVRAWFPNGTDAEVLAARALDRHAAARGEPFEVLRRLGGREIAAMTGAILAARMQKIPVLLDGTAAIAAASVLHALDASALDHCRLAAAQGAAARNAAAHIGLAPLFDFGIQTGEGASAAQAAAFVRSAARLAAGMSDIGASARS